MRGLIVLNPYAMWLADGDKVNAAGEIIEFRNRKTHIQGQVAIRAGAPIPCAHCPVGNRMDLLAEEKQCCEEFRDQTRCVREVGKVLCLATLADCRPVTEADREVPGCPEGLSGFAWVFTDLLTLPEPVPCKLKPGAQTWFEVPPDVEAEVLRQSAREGEGRA